MQKRTSSWRQLLKQYKTEFLEWLEGNGQRLSMFNKLAEDLERYLFKCLTPDSNYNGSSKQYLCLTFIDCIPDALSKCDEKGIYDEKEMFAPAYAHIHLLERYRRFWDVLLCLLEVGVLPMSDKELEVLDLGTGPAPVLYAVTDFYQAFRDFANEKGYTELVPGLNPYSTVEASRNMEHFMHRFSEEGDRNGPFFTTFREFDNLDFSKLRENKREEVRKGENYFDGETGEWETWYELENNLGWTEGLYRYNLVIFSNFLTVKRQVNKWRKELLSTFKTLRHGGVVVIVGSNAEKYKPVYDLATEIAESVSLSIVPAASKEIPVEYRDLYAKRIKKHFDNIWGWIKEEPIIDEQFLISKNIPRYFWDPQEELEQEGDPQNFNLLVFRNDRQPYNKKRKK
jgi:hypothetical protein